MKKRAHGPSVTLSRAKSALATAALLLLVMILNLSVGRIEEQGALRLDLSANQFTTLSEATRQVLANLDSPVYLHLLYRAGTRDDMRTNLESLLSRYRAENPHIIVDVIDPLTEPGRVNRYAQDAGGLTEGSLIVTDEGERRARIIYSRELFNYRVDPSTNAYQASSFVGESKITSAILYASTTDTPRVYFLTGHDEIASSYCTVIAKQLQDENYEVADLALGRGTPLNAGDTLIVLAPTKDLADAEYRELKEWLENGGRLIYINDPAIDMAALVNFSRLLSYYDLRFADGFVVEGENALDSYLSSPLYLVPQIGEQSEITAPLSDGRMLLPSAGAIQQPGMPLAGHIYKALLTSSRDAFLKARTSGTGILSREAADEAGPFILAISLLRENDPNDSRQDTRIVLIANPYVIVDSNYLQSSYNLEFTMNCIDWLSNRQTGVSIRSKAIAPTALPLPDAATFWRLAALTVVFMPATVLLAGLAVWLRRRHK